MPDDSSDPSSDDSRAVNETSPRAFATTTGVVFQIVGLAFLLAGGSYWVISGRLERLAPVPIDTTAAFLDPANIILTVTTANVLTLVTGGLALAAFGVGLQGELRRSGTYAMIAAGLLTIVELVSVILFVAFGPAWIRMVVVFLLAVVNAILFLLAGQSASILKAHPPPPDQSVVDDAWLENYARNRRR